MTKFEIFLIGIIAGALLVTLFCALSIAHDPTEGD